MKVGLNIVGFKEQDSLRIGYRNFNAFREWCLDLMPLDFQLALRLWMDSEDPEPKVPEGWMWQGLRYKAWEFFTHSDCEGEFWDTDVTAEFLSCLKERASCRIRDNEWECCCYGLLIKIETIFRESDIVSFR